MNKTLAALPGKAPALPPGAFEIGYTAHDGAQHRVPLAEAAVVRFADTQPTRRIRTRKGQRHLPGRWWSATDGRHIAYESWLERDHLIAMDFDQAVGNRLGAVLVVLGRRRQGPLPRTGLLRPPGRRINGGGRLPAGGAAPGRTAGTCNYCRDQNRNDIRGEWVITGSHPDGLLDERGLVIIIHGPAGLAGCGAVGRTPRVHVGRR
jgi:hypothetical protein